MRHVSKLSLSHTHTYTHTHTQDLRSGSISLRWLMKHVSMLTTQLYRVQPAS